MPTSPLALDTPRRRPTRETLEALREAEEVLQGTRPAGTERHSGSILGGPQFREEAARLVKMGRLVADPVYVNVIEWDRIAGSIDRFWLYHHDLVWLFIGEKRDTLGAFFHTHLNTRNYPPMHRVMLPHPILQSDWGGTMDRSLMAVEAGEVASLLRRFITWESVVRRFTDAQRKAYKEKFGKDLMDQYFEIKGHPVTITVAGRPLKMDLFLPSGMDYSLSPVTAPGQPISFVQTKPDPLVQAAGYKVFCEDFMNIPLTLNRADGVPP